MSTDPPDEATKKLLLELTRQSPSASDLNSLYHTLLVKLQYLTNGTILSGGGVHILQHVKLFIEHQPEVCYI